MRMFLCFGIATFMGMMIFVLSKIDYDDPDKIVVIHFSRQSMTTSHQHRIVNDQEPQSLFWIIICCVREC